MSGIYFEKNPNATTSRRFKMNTKTNAGSGVDARRTKELSKQFPPGTYTVVKPVNLRNGADVESERIRKLSKGEKVEVAEVASIKGVARARIVAPASGWTSLVSSKGIQCLALEARQVGEKTWDDIKQKAKDSGKGVVGMDTWNELKNGQGAQASKLSAKHDRISKAVQQKREIPSSGKVKSCPECDTRFDACWGQCPNCNGDLAKTWKEDGQQEAQQPQQVQQQMQMQRGVGQPVNAQPQVQINPTYQIMYQPIYQHMAQPTFQIDSSQQSATTHTNMMFPAQQMYGGQPAAAMPQMYAQVPTAQHSPQQYVQVPVAQHMAVPQVQYMPHAQQVPTAQPQPQQRLVRGASLLQEAFQGMNQQQGQQQPLPEMTKLSVDDYVHQLEKASASPRSQVADPFAGSSKQELQQVGLTYYPIQGQMPKEFLPKSM